MSGSINKVILVGNVGKDPEIRSTQDGREIASFTIATSETWKDKITGEKKDKTEWHRITVFSEGLVKLVKNYIKKGSKLYVEGALQTRKWIDNAGVEKYSTDIVLQGFNGTITMLDSKTNNSENFSKDSSPFSNNTESYVSDIDDEIPF